MAHVRSNVVRKEKEPVLCEAIKEIAPEWWGDETRVTVNQDVVCQRHRDGNTGHSWMLWLVITQTEDNSTLMMGLSST